jgi:hypothetical protein
MSIEHMDQIDLLSAFAVPLEESNLSLYPHKYSDFLPHKTEPTRPQQNRRY